MEPILKWAGGKRLLLPEIIKHIDFDELRKNNATYYEPFVGGGALCFYAEYSKVVINDFNSDVINVYKVIKNNHKKLISELKLLETKFNNDSNFYYEIRALDRDKDIYSSLSNVQRAARTIFLNKTCYNGLYRVNSKGQYNVPIGRYKKVDIVNEEKITLMHNYLKNNDVIIRNDDFAKVVEDAKNGDLVYFDPPYDYEPSGFTSYNPAGFDKNDTRRLKQVCDDLIKKGCFVIISNNDTKYINELFSEEFYSIYHITAHRFINRNGQSRNSAREVVICGYKR